MRVIFKQFEEFTRFLNIRKKKVNIIRSPTQNRRDCDACNSFNSEDCLESKCLLNNTSTFESIVQIRVNNALLISALIVYEISKLSVTR